MVRVVTRREFRRACKAHGFKGSSIDGFYEIRPGVFVGIPSSARNLRSALVYLVEARDRFDELRPAARVKVRDRLTALLLKIPEVFHG